MGGAYESERSGFEPKQFQLFQYFNFSLIRDWRQFGL